ncbi:hypothetical protein LCGC14_1448880, partial [marine sediment metagenome]
MSKKIGTLFQHAPEVGSYKGSTDLVLGRARVGVEIEVDRVDGGWVMLRDIVATSKDERAGLWKVVEDGSVHNHGAEMVFTRPLFGQDVVDALDYFLALQKEYLFNHSLETGIHVHLDVRNMDYESFRKLCILYGLVEPLLFNWIGEDREYNIFCEPWYRSQGDLVYITDILFGSDYKKVSAAGKVQRYSALNLTALRKFGSIEFRQMPTVFDKAKILKWLNIILSLKKAALSIKENDYGILTRLSADGPDKFFQDIFPLKNIAPELLQGNYFKPIEIGCLIVQDIILAHKGKTTVKNALWEILTKRSDTVSHGATKGRIKIKLSDGSKTIIAERITTKKSSVLSLIDQDGDNLSAADFKSMISDLSVNPHQITKLKGDEQVRVLLRAADIEIDLQAVNIEIAELEEERLTAHRSMSVLKPSETVPEEVEKVSLSELLAEIEKGEAVNSTNSDSREKLADLEIAHTNTVRQITQAEEQLKALKTQEKTLAERIEKGKAVCK